MSTVHEPYQLRGYVRESGHRRLETTLGQCAILYNAALQERRDAYRMKGEYRSYIDQAKELTFIRKDLPEWEELAVGIGRGVLRRVDLAYNAFFRRVKAGQTPGVPRFKPRQRYTCIDVADPTPAMVKHSPDGSKAYIRVKVFNVNYFCRFALLHNKCYSTEVVASSKMLPKKVRQPYGEQHEQDVKEGVVDHHPGPLPVLHQKG